MKEHFVREVRIETHSHSMSDWFAWDIETEATEPVFLAVEQRSRRGAGRQDELWGALVFVDTGTADRYDVGERVTHRHPLILVKSRDGMAQAHPGASKYLGSFVCEYGFRWFAFRAKPKEQPRGADGPRPRPASPPAGSFPAPGSKQPQDRAQPERQSSSKPQGGAPSPRT